jgi:hypothetical protein
VEKRGIVTRDEARFSILQTALQYRPIQRWVGIDLQTEPEPDQIDEDALDQLARWTLVAERPESGRATPRVNSRHLQELSEIVASDDARDAFAKGATLEHALRLTGATSTALLEAINEARSAVGEARSHAARLEGPPEDRHLDAISRLEGVVGDLARDLRGGR